MPMPTRKRPADLGSELGIDVIEGQIDGAGRAQRLAAARLHTVMLAEDGQQAVAQELVDPAAVVWIAEPVAAKNSLRMKTTS